VGNRKNSHSLRPLYGHGVELCIGAGKTGTPRRQRNSDGRRGVEGYSDDQTRGCGASSMQQTRGLLVTSLNPVNLPTVDLWSTFYTHAATCINDELPARPWSPCGLQFTLQCAVIWFVKPRLTLWQFRVWAQGGGGGWL